jgi:hypothetical protein
MTIQTLLPLTWELNLRISDVRICPLESTCRRREGDLDLCITFRVETNEVPTIVVESANTRILQRLSTATLYEIEKLLKNPDVSGFSEIKRVLF